MKLQTLLMIETAAHRVIGTLVEIAAAFIFFGVVAILWIITP